ncbi:MAG: hypothetical protein WDM92_14720 [Caulobacteraceae bacterium]
MAHAFAKAGMKVVIADIRQEALDRAMAGFAGTNLAVHAGRNANLAAPLCAGRPGVLDGAASDGGRRRRALSSSPSCC